MIYMKKIPNISIKPQNSAICRVQPSFTVSLVTYDPIQLDYIVQLIAR
jgi:hypothetical protein